MPRIPKEFTLGSLTVRVRIVSAETMRACNVAANGPEAASEEPPWGLWVDGESAIFFQKTRVGFSKAKQYQTFWHEYFHALFDALSESDMSANEKLVDQCGLLHAQAAQTMKY